VSYIIFKDKYSTDIKGLIISELPPITKPELRVRKTEIDGRDGDIIEDLGYASYDKKIKIGLSYNYDVDEIIDYFSGSGDLIMSNEEDKVYKAKIYSKTDYEKLINFKTANITFHCQPFKYWYHEPPFIHEIKSTDTEYKVTNAGLLESKPTMTLWGNGEVTIAINGYDVFTIEIDDEYVTIDSMEQEAYKDSTLKNNHMTGDFPTLKSGVNIITWTGDLTKIKVESNSRWL